MKATGAFAAVLPLIFLLGCSTPADGVAESNVGQVSENGGTIPQPSPEEITYFAIDPATSTISFVGSNVTGKHDGGFRTFAGEFHVADGRLAPSGHKVVITQLVGIEWRPSTSIGGSICPILKRLYSGGQQLVAADQRE